MNYFPTLESFDDVKFPLMVDPTVRMFPYRHYCGIGADVLKSLNDIVLDSEIVYDIDELFPGAKHNAVYEAIKSFDGKVMFHDSKEHTMAYYAAYGFMFCNECNSWLPYVNDGIKGIASPAASKIIPNIDYGINSYLRSPARQEVVLNWVKSLMSYGDTLYLWKMEDRYDTVEVSNEPYTNKKDERIPGKYSPVLGKYILANEKVMATLKDWLEQDSNAGIKDDVAYLYMQGKFGYYLKRDTLVSPKAQSNSNNSNNINK